MTTADKVLGGKVLVTGSSVSDETLDALSKRGLRVHNPKHLLGKDELMKELSDSVGYLLGGDENADADVLKSTKQLKVIAFLGMGYENYVDAIAADGIGIVVTNTPGTLTDSCAEYVVAQLLNGRRKIVAYGAERRRDASFEPSNQLQLSGHTYGVVGLGSIGERVAEILTQAFHCPVVYWSRTRKPEVEKRLGIAYKTLNEVASSSDGIVVATVGTPETQGLISEEVVGQMKEGTVLVNVARADVVDHGALRSGLRSGRIGVATFDPIYADSTVAASLFDEFNESRLIATPHIASLTFDAREAMGKKAVQSIINVLETGDDEYNVAR
jgi:lactate dehydrogenase-like 2-hydroxyacid dehydrogenase